MITVIDKVACHSKNRPLVNALKRDKNILFCSRFFAK